MAGANSNVSTSNLNNLSEVFDASLNGEGSPSTSSNTSSDVSYNGNDADTNNTSISSGNDGGSDVASDMDIDSDVDSDTESMAVSNMESDLSSEMDENVDEDMDGDIDENIIEEENGDEDMTDHVDVVETDGSSTTSTDETSEDGIKNRIFEDKLNSIAEELLQDLRNTSIDDLLADKAHSLLDELETSTLPSSTEIAINEMFSDLEIQNYLREHIATDSAWLKTKRPHPRAFFKFSFVQETMAMPYPEQAVYEKFNRGNINIINNQIYPCEFRYLEALLQDFSSSRLIYFLSIFRPATDYHERSFKIVLAEFLRLYYVPDLLPNTACRVWFFNGFKALLQGLYKIGQILKERRNLHSLVKDLINKSIHRKTSPRVSYESPWHDFLGMNVIESHKCNRGCALWRHANACLLSPVAIRLLSLNEFPILNVELWMKKKHPNEAPAVRMPWTMYQRQQQILLNHRPNLPVFQSFLCDMPQCLKQYKATRMQTDYPDSMNYINKFLGKLRDGKLPDFRMFPARMLVNYHVPVENYELFY